MKFLVIFMFHDLPITVYLLSQFLSVCVSVYQGDTQDGSLRRLLQTNKAPIIFLSQYVSTVCWPRKKTMDKVIE